MQGQNCLENKRKNEKNSTLAGWAYRFIFRFKYITVAMNAVPVAMKRIQPSQSGGVQAVIVKLSTLPGMTFANNPALVSTTTQAWNPQHHENPAPNPLTSMVLNALAEGVYLWRRHPANGFG